MNALPEQMTDRWRYRADPAPGEGTVYWHILMRNYPQVIDLARDAQDRLAEFSGLHMTPLKRLHMTTLLAGPAAAFTRSQLDRMTEVASELLANTPPVVVSLDRILYHPEAIMLGVTPVEALTPIRNAAARATGLAPDDKVPDSNSGWIPHVTICYSTADQPAGPIITALDEYQPQCDIQINTLSLVVQHGPERHWDWSTVATIDLTASALI